MFGSHLAESCRARLHRFLLLVLSIFVQVAMFLRNTESFKWIRKRFGFRAHPSHGPDSRPPTATHNRSLETADVDPKETTTIKTILTSTTNDDGKCLNEVFVVNNDSLSSSTVLSNCDDAIEVSRTAALTSSNNINNNNSTNLFDELPICAPIAREEDADESDANQNEIDSNCEEVSASSATPISSTVRRSKSRVRTYLRRCRERFTGHQHQSIVSQTEEDANANVIVDVNADRLTVVEEGTEHRVCPEVDDRLSVVTAADENDHGSYEDIDFGLTSVERGANGDDDLLAEIDAHQAERHREQEELKLQRTKEEQMESGLAALIDVHLGPVYPVYQERTRAVLLREARDLLVVDYDGSLQTFERQFLASAAQIASELRRKHAIGESLVWCKGWPLATPAGEVILHLGAPDEALVRPTDIYLCIKAVDKSTPKLHAVWRSAPSSDGATTLRSRCIDHRDPKAYLSILELEMMLSDELPQLLQSLLVGVERAIGRLSIGELTAPSDVVDKSSHHNLNINNNKHNTITNSLASPKCGLRRSELITKNKMLNNKFMLRRLTNRQDSMTSTSSGNSCSSSGSSTGSGASSSSDDLIGGGAALAMMTSSATTTTLNRSTGGGAAGGGSPSLPLFCLGNSFPHIDSDEENADEKRNSLDCDTSLSEEIVPPRSICEIPEKLLTSGIYLPGTRDLKGRPIVTVDADCLMSSGLNCYEVATVMLYYNTITESIGDFNCNQQMQQPAKQQLQPERKHDHEEHVAAATVSQQPAPQTFTILIAIERANHLTAIDLICQSLKLLVRHIEFCEILAVCLDRSLLQLAKQRSSAQPPQSREQEECNKQQQPLSAKEMEKKEQPQQQSSHSVRFISVDEVTTSVAAPSQVPAGRLRGLRHHEPRKWREFFGLVEPFQSQCVATGRRLVTAMNEIRCSDMQSPVSGLTATTTVATTRRQLYAQHRALSRALMDSELHNLRKRGPQTLARLQDLARAINGPAQSNNNKNNSNSNLYNNNHIGYSYVNRKSSATATTLTTATLSTTTTSGFVTSYSTAAASGGGGGGLLNSNNNNNIDVAIRLHKVTLLFNEVDRAAKRLEQLTEQRRERLRELTRQSTLEDEINEVTSWITSDGNETLQRFSGLQFDGEATTFKEHEQEFEKYYFISMKHLAKGRDLHQAAVHMDALHESAAHLKAALDCFAAKLEQARERIEGASRLHQLLTTGRAPNDDEVQRLAEKIGVTPILLEKWRQQEEADAHADNNPIAALPEPRGRTKPNSLNLSLNLNQNQSRANVAGTTVSTPTPTQTKPNTIFTSTPLPKQPLTKVGSGGSSTGGSEGEGISSGTGTGSGLGQGCHCWRESRNVEDVDAMLDEDADPEDDEREKRETEEEEQSKIADSGLGGCDRCEGNPKLSRICSCQSLNEAGNLYDKGHNSDDLDDECFEQPSKRFLNIHSPMEANAHLQCHASSLDLPKMEELSCLEPKIQKTLLLIMREMIGTERDYVRSLYYVIDNYVDELLRDDIPQPLRGQRNVIFGNIEKIFEFHNSHFLRELERYEHNPLKVGAAFLEMESKFYLYALYNKNKPKSDTLLSEYGTTFFKSKQLELNDKMDLASYLLKPVQRMGKYALLLQQLVKACSSVQGSALQEIAADVEELQRAEEMVKFQLRHGNDLLAMDSLRDCDVNVKEQGRLMRQNEFLVWQGRGGKKSLRQVFLFEELVLFSKARRFPDHKNLDIYIYKNSIKTSDIGLTAHVGDSPTKFEIWFRKRKPEDTWTLQCMSEDIKNAWTEEISKLLWKQAKRNRDIRLAEMSSMGIGSKPCLDIRPSHNQISDRSITISQLGKAPKLRHSFVGLHPESGKTTKRPNSLISESSVSSGTSSSSTSTGSSSGSSGGKHGTTSSGHHHHHHGLELINETQTLKLAAGESGGGNNNCHSNCHSNTLSSNASSTASGHLRNHKRSTTLVSQLSMESGILSDISMTPDQEQLPDSAAMTWSSTTVVMRRKCSNTNATTTAAMNAKNLESEQHPSLGEDRTGLEERIANVKV